MACSLPSCRVTEISASTGEPGQAIIAAISGVRNSSATAASSSRSCKATAISPSTREPDRVTTEVMSGPSPRRRPAVSSSRSCKTMATFASNKGTGPADNRGFVWGTMATDPVEDVEIASIEYDVAAAKTLQSGPAELYRQTVRNDTTQAQTSSINGSATVSETSG